MTDNINQPKRPVRRVRQQNVNQVPNKKVKQWTKAWWKWLIIWMWVFVFFIIFLIFAFFFYLTANPNSAKWLGIWPSTIKSVTSIFAWLVFGTFFVIFLIMWLSYVYKLATQSANKTKNAIGAVIIFFLWIWNITLWYLVYSRIAKIQVTEFNNVNDVLIANINYMDKDWKEKYVPLYQNNYPLIWPIKVSFQLNTRIYRNVELPKIIKQNGAINPVKFVLECGNGQEIEYYPNANMKFPLSKYCLYLKKNTKQKPYYRIRFKLIYDTNRQKNKVYYFNDKQIQIATNIEFKSKYKLNWTKDEIIVWERWDKITLDLANLTEDLKWINDYNFDIDFEWNGHFINSNWDSLVSYVYSKAGKYNIILRLPDIEQAPYYYFPVIVKPSTKPLCSIAVNEKNGKYYFKIKWEKANAPIKWYYYVLRNITNNNEVIKKWKGNFYKTILKNWSDYQMEATIYDTNKKKWKCFSEIINLSNKLNYKFDVYLNWEKIEDYNISVWKLPSKYEIKIWNITPENDNLEVWFDLDWDLEIDESSDIYEFKIKDKKDTTINLIVYDEFWNKTVKTLQFKVDLKPLIWDLQVSVSEWEAPLKVKFDASASEVTNEDDKIVYFNWDFWDGEVLENTRQWVVEHVYKKYWQYVASVKIITKKWYSDTLKKKIDVYRPINSSKIIFPNNLWGTASVWSSVSMMLNTSWNVKSIEWNFWDGQEYSCTSRECLSISHTYEKPWKFRVKAKVYYTDGSPASTAFASIYIK